MPDARDKFSSKCATDLGRCPTLHIYAYATQRSCGWLACWLRWAAQMQASLPTEHAAYELHVRTYEEDGVLSSFENYIRGVRAKVFWMEQTVNRGRLRARDVHLFTDLDVVPLGSYWRLAREGLQGHNISFLSEIQDDVPASGHSWFSNWAVNSGFCTRSLAHPTHVAWTSKHSPRGY